MVGDIWKLTNHYIVPSTAREVMAVIGSIGVYSTGQQFAWRGMSSADFSLTSSLHRRFPRQPESVLRKAEMNIIADARRWGLGTHPAGRVDDLQLLADLQHFGVPTRLIDVTTNPMTALWFACRPAPKELGKSGLLLALNMTAWQRHSTVSSGAEITRAQVEDPEGARLRAILEAQDPVVVESAAPNARLRAQEGFFITSAVPTVRQPIDGKSAVTLVDVPFESLRVGWPREVDPEALRARLRDPARGRPRTLPFVAVIIKANLKSSLRAYLDGTFNRSERVLFPDYEGFSLYGRHITEFAN